MNLSELQQGEKGIIVKIRGRGVFHKRITEMGFVRGQEVEVVRRAPLGDPLEYNIMGYNVSLRRSEAQLIEIVSTAEMEASPEKWEMEYHKGIVDESERLKVSAEEKSKIIDIVFVGNPNSGKTSLFNAASGAHEKVGNYSGVTIEAKKAVFKQDGYTFNIIDLPGTYSLSPYSFEELYVREYIIDKAPDVIVNIVDASNLERNLYLTTQLIDMDVKVVVALNMFDELKAKGDELEREMLSTLLGIPMMATIANKGIGIKNLFSKIVDVYEDRNPFTRHIHINYGPQVEQAVSVLQKQIRSNKSFVEKVASRYYALKLLEKDSIVEKETESWPEHNDLHEVAKKEITKLEHFYNSPSETIIADARYGFIAGALKETFKRNKKTNRFETRTEKIDSVLTHKFWGFPIFLFFIWLMFFCTFQIGQYPMEWMEMGVSFIAELTQKYISSPVLNAFISEGIIGGVGGVIVFLPNIVILFLFISLMEDTGYMARVAFLMDKLMHHIGLHGKSFIPMIMGFGCNVPAIMATRTLENRSDRLLTMLTIPFMSCSARLPVYILLIGAFFPNHPVSILFSIYLFGIVLAIGFALIFKKRLFRSNNAPFVMELPPYRVPTFISVVQNMWMKAKQYLKKMGGIILIASVIIWVLGYFPLNKHIDEKYDQQIVATEAHFAALAQNNPDSTAVFEAQKTEAIDLLNHRKGGEKIESSFIGQLGKVIEPVIRPLGFDWKVGVGLFSGVAAKEVLVSTMSILYQVENEEDGGQLADKLKSETYLSGPKAGQKVFTQASAASLLVFVLVYFPCVAVFAAVAREAGRWKWAMFLVTYTTVLAWILSFAVYHIANWVL